MNAPLAQGDAHHNNADMQGNFPDEDMLTPQYYQLGDADAFKSEVESFIALVRQEQLWYPLKDEFGAIPDFVMPPSGGYGNGKGGW